MELFEFVDEFPSGNLRNVRNERARMVGRKRAQGCTSGKPYPEVDNPKTRASVMKRLAKYTRFTEDGCIEWTGYKNQQGYGRMLIWDSGKKRLLAVHKLAHEIFYGPVPEGKVVMHICDNRCCVNPKHLTIGTQSDNLEDARRKGRNWGSRPYVESVTGVE